MSTEQRNDEPEAEIFHKEYRVVGSPIGGLLSHVILSLRFAFVMPLGRFDLRYFSDAFQQPPAPDVGYLCVVDWMQLHVN